MVTSIFASDTSGLSWTDVVVTGIFLVVTSLFAPDKVFLLLQQLTIGNIGMHTIKVKNITLPSVTAILPDITLTLGVNTFILSDVTPTVSSGELTVLSILPAD